MKRINLRDLPKIIAQDAELMLQNIAKETAQMAIDNAPEDTGALKANIVLTVNESAPEFDNSEDYNRTISNNDDKAASIRLTDKIEIVSTAPYSLYVEEGTDKAQAQPFLRPTVDSFAAIVGRACDKVK